MVVINDTGRFNTKLQEWGLLQCQSAPWQSERVTTYERVGAENAIQGPHAASSYS
jgi:hypothetical protein